MDGDRAKIKKAGPKKGWPLLTYEKHLVTKIAEFLYYANFPYKFITKRKKYLFTERIITLFILKLAH